MSEVKVGDLVRIREWDDMKEEFGLDRNRDIKCCATFTKGMSYLCGKEFDVIEITETGRIRGHSFPFAISTDMVVVVDEDELYQGGEILDEFLRGFRV